MQMSDEYALPLTLSVGALVLTGAMLFAMQSDDMTSKTLHANAEDAVEAGLDEGLASHFNECFAVQGIQNPPGKPTLEQVYEVETCLYERSGQSDERPPRFAVEIFMPR